MESGMAGKRRVLLVEDDPSLRDALTMFLRAKGYDVETAEDGKSARRMLEGASYDVLVTDLMMPVVSGYELVAGIQSNPPPDPPAVIVMTGQGSVESALGVMKSGVSAFLRKPLNMDELEVAVSSAADRNRLDKQLVEYYRELDAKVAARTRELEMLSRFSSAVNSTFDLDGILTDAVAYLKDSLEADAAWIYLLGGTGSLELRAHKGFSDGLASSLSVLDTAKGFSGKTFKDGGAFILNEMPESTNIPIVGAIASEGFRTAMHSAIKSGNRVLGSMGIASKSGYRYKESDLQLLTSFGDQIGVAVEKTSLYDKEKSTAENLRNRVDQLVLLNEMGNMLRVTKSLDVAVKAVVTSVAQGLGLDRVCLWLLDGERSQFKLQAAKGIDDSQIGTTVPATGVFHGKDVTDCEAELRTGGSLCSRLGTGWKPLDGKDTSTSVVLLFAGDPAKTDLRCWEHFGCEETGCKAYGNPMACWMVDESCLRKFDQAGTLIDKMAVCGECDVYRAGARGSCIGALCVERTREAISGDDMRTLGVFANTAAAALENIRLMERMIKSERFIESIMANMASGLLVTDLEGRVKVLNNVGADILGVNRKALAGRPITELVPETARLITVERSPVGHEVVISTPDGPIPVGYSNSHLKEPDGVTEGVIVVFRDLSDIKRLQERIRETDRFAAIGKVAAGVAHEIRNPLFGITSVAQILGRETPSASPLKALIDAMLSETSRLNTLVEEMLLYGRATKISPVSTDIASLILDVVEFHKQAIQDKGINVATSFADGLPSMMVDPHQMRQIFLNLLFNSLDATPSGGNIGVTAMKKDGALSISISDNGIGIPEEELAKVFDLFFTTKDKGTGLGLAICRKIVEDHGGTVSIRSTQGKGTEVEVSLPLGQV